MLQFSEGNECRSEREIGEEIAKYFESLFITNNPQKCDEILQGIPRIISKSMKRNLTRNVEDQEIKETLFFMNPHKAPESDCMSPFFFQKYWHILRHDICEDIKSFF